MDNETIIRGMLGFVACILFGIGMSIAHMNPFLSAGVGMVTMFIIMNVGRR